MKYQIRPALVLLTGLVDRGGFPLFSYAPDVVDLIIFILSGTSLTPAQGARDKSLDNSSHVQAGIVQHDGERKWHKVMKEKEIGRGSVNKKKKESC